MTLSIRRFLNLAYYRLIEWMPADKRKELDRHLSDVPSNSPDGAPSWWEDDEEASTSGLAMARALGFRTVMN